MGNNISKSAIAAANLFRFTAAALGGLGLSCWRDRAVPPGPTHAKLSLLREHPRHVRDGRHRGFVRSAAFLIPSGWMDSEQKHAGAARVFRYR